MIFFLFRTLLLLVFCCSVVLSFGQTDNTNLLDRIAKLRKERIERDEDVNKVFHNKV